MTIDFQIPAAQKGANIDTLVTAGSQGDWSTPATDVIGQLLELNAAAEKASGYPIRHVWINSTTLNLLLDNDKLQAVGGSAFRIFDSLTMTQVDTSAGPRQSGYIYVFRAIPQFIFHVYDGVLNVNVDDNDGNTNAMKIVPDDYAIFTPEPGDWMGMAEGSEVVQENYNTQPREVFGFHSWSTPVLDPGGRELKMVDNFLPVLYVPRSVYYLKVDNQ